MPLTSLLPRFRLLTLLALIALVALSLTLLPLETWRDAQAIEELSKGPFGVNCKWERPKSGLAALLPWKKRVVGVVIDNWEPAVGQTQIPAASLNPLQRLTALEFYQLHDFGSDYPMPPIPSLPQVKTLWLVCNIDAESTESLGSRLPNLQHLYVAPGDTPEDTGGMFSSVLSLPTLRIFECWGLRLSASDLIALEKSQIEEIDIKDGMISDEVLGQFANLVALKKLFIWSNELTDGCLDAIARLKKSASLKEIYILMPFTKETQIKIEEKKLLEARKGQTISIDPL